MRGEREREREREGGRENERERERERGGGGGWSRVVSTAVVTFLNPILSRMHWNAKPTESRISTIYI